MSDVIREFTTDIPYWNPYVTPIALENATAEQREALQVTPSNTKVSEYVLVLAHDPESLLHRTPLFNNVMYGRNGLSRADRELGALAASIVNHCIYCSAVHASRYNTLTKTENVVAEIFRTETAAKLDARSQAIFDYAVALSYSPPQAGDEHIAALKAVGFSDLEILDLTLSAAMFGWANRLMHTLGEPKRPS